MSDARPEPVSGFLLVDKGQGWTSHDVVAKTRGMMRQKKVGHAGTLDPMATGLLVLGLGAATRLMRFIQGAEKVYEATALFGVATDSLDADGSILSREPMPVERSDIEAAAERFVGDIQQVPPMVSALKIDGRRLYDLAREGKVVERKARPVTIHALEITDVAPSDYPEVSFRVRCSTGTYIRTLGDDLAAALGGRAHLTALRRVSNGPLDVDAAHTLESLQEHTDAGTIRSLVMDPVDGLDAMDAFRLNAETERAVRNGVSFPVTALGIEPGDRFLKMLGTDGALRAVYAVDGNKVAAEVVIP